MHYFVCSDTGIHLTFEVTLITENQLYTQKSKHMIKFIFVWHSLKQNKLSFYSQNSIQITIFLSYQVVVLKTTTKNMLTQMPEVKKIKSAVNLYVYYDFFLINKAACI